MSLCPAVLYRNRFIPPHEFTGIFSMSPPSTPNPQFSVSETSQLPNMSVVPENNYDSMIATSRVESTPQPLPSPVFDFNGGAQTMDTSAWQFPAQLPDAGEEAATFDIGHMSMFQHQSDLTFPSRPMGSPNSFTYLTGPQIPMNVDYPTGSPTMSELTQAEMDHGRQFSPIVQGIPGVPPWLNRHSPYPEFPRQGTPSQYHVSSPGSPYDDEHVQQPLTDSESPMMIRGASDDLPYAQWLYECLKEAPGHQMILRDIYAWGVENIPKVREALESDSQAKGWQNSIRHNLSMNQVPFPKHVSAPPFSNYLAGIHQSRSTR
jgi:forkhead-containing protein